MFNLKKVFRKVNQSFEPVRNPQDVIAEIHEAFDSSTERLLNEAKQILSQNSNTDKGEKLKSLGFVKSKDAIEVSEKLKTKKEQEEIADNIHYFRRNHLHNICHLHQSNLMPHQ